MDTQLLTLSKIFTERLFRIPDYQRGYAWNDKQLRDFWSDIQQLEGFQNHYTGVLTLEAVPKAISGQWDDDRWIIDAKNYQPFYVVDGQQRLTTAIILIQTILEKLTEVEKINYTSKEDVQRKFIFDSKNDGISRSYVFGYEKDNPSYEYLKTEIFLEKSATATSQETIYTQNLERAKKFFIERVAVLSSSERETLFRKATQQLLFNIFTITEDVDVCVAFETMNNRGKPLSYLELLKNRLIYLSLKFDAEDFERGQLRAAINNCWKSIYHNLGRNKNKPLDDDRFLFTHYIIYFGERMSGKDGDEEAIRFRNLYRIDYASDLLEKRFIPKNVTPIASNDERVTLTDIYKYVSSLQESVQMWYKIWNPFDSGLDRDSQIWLDKLNRLESGGLQPLVLVFMQNVDNKAKRVAFLQAVERFLFARTLMPRYLSPYGFEYNPISLKLAIDLSSRKTTPEKVTKAIEDEAMSFIKRKDFSKEITAYFRQEGFYAWEGARYFFYEYDLSLQSRSKTERPKIFWPEFTEQKSDYVSIEHIYPQRARDKYWIKHFGHLTQKQKTSLRNSIGNLLPLSKPKNSSLSNKAFPDKVAGKEGSTVGYRFGCYAENEVALREEWTPAEVLTRGLRLLKFMEERWGIEIGDEQKKIAMLGLEFLKPQTL